MPNKIKYNSGVDANALNIGNWSVGANLGMGPTASTGFENGFEIPEGGYAIYQHSDIKGRIAHNDAELILIMNKLGDNSSTKEGALNWARQNNVLVLNENLDNITTNGLVAYFDPSKVASYPGYNTVYSLGNGNTLSVGDTNLISDGKFSFDGSAHGQSVSSYVSLNADSPNTVEVVFKMNAVPSADQAIFTDNWGPEYGIWARPNGRIGYAAYGVYDNPNSTFTPGKWHHAVMTMDPGATNSGATDQTELAAFFDGQLIGENIMYNTGNGMNDQPFTIGYDNKGGSPAAYMNGDVAYVRMYNRRLGADEVSQNYYHGPIVTRNLTQHYDFKNLVCYDQGETEIRNLVNPSSSAAIVNTSSAISYNKQLGYLEWTGDSNAYIDIPDTGQMAKFSLSTWVWNDRTGANSRHSILRNFWEIVDTSIQFWSYDFDNDYWRSSGNGAVPYDTWTHITTTWDGSVIRHYINGVLYWTDSNTSGGTSQNMYHFGGYSGRMLDGKYATLSIYNDELTAQEILDNYNAHAYRFK